MKNRKNNLKARRNNRIWNKIGMKYDGICPVCGGNDLIHIYRHDARACISCNIWLEPKCGGEDCDCPFCKDRPDTPYEVYWLEKEIPSDALEVKRWRQDNYMHKVDGKIKHIKRYKNDKE
ncbi:MAG: hypothetical protein K6G88_10270 [Lachnospiraceae bacterium]|jgi:hypothetical protein|nr:hypothetical protein [Lachnospiraceae bacterium]